MRYTLEDEINLARDIAFLDDKPEELKWILIGNYNDCSFIFRVTNERINTKEYIDVLKDKKKVLSVIASGDQILNSILFGSKEIFGYDISLFPKYYLKLKIAAIESLSLKDYKEFFYGRRALNKDMYKTVSTKLDDRNKAFWDALIKKGKKNIALTDLFCTDMSSINVASENNPYMDEENYKDLKSKIKNINLRLMNADIYGYREEMKESFDLVNLSSILVANSLIPPTFTAQKEFMRGFKLNKNGEVLTYIFDTEFDRVYEGWDKFPNEEDFKLYDLNDKDGVKEDAILVYKKVK
jgi:hypothetical protein